MVNSGQVTLALEGRMRRVVGAGAIPVMRYDHPHGGAFAIDVFERSALMAAGAAGWCNLTLPQRPDFHLCIFPTKGLARHTVDFVSYQCRRGTMLHVRPGQVHQWEPTADADAVCVIFSPAFLPRDRPHAADGPALLPLTAWPPQLTLSDSEHDEMAQLFTLMLAHQRAAQAGVRSAPFLRQLVQAGLVLMKQAATPEPRPNAAGLRELFERFALLLDSRFAAQHDVTGYARTLGVSSRTLNRACELSAARNAKAVIDDRVALEAKRLLAYSTLTIAAIASQLCFSEATNFVKFFRRLVGESPSTFRQRETREA